MQSSGTIVRRECEVMSIYRHCEARSDEAIQSVSAEGFWFASLPPTRSCASADFCPAKLAQRAQTGRSQ